MRGAVISGMGLLLILVATVGCRNVSRSVRDVEFENLHERLLGFDYREQVTLTSDPAGWTVYRYGEPIGQTPLTLEIDYGRMTGSQQGLRHSIEKTLVVQEYVVEDRSYTGVLGQRVKQKNLRNVGEPQYYPLEPKKSSRIFWASDLRLHAPSPSTLFQVSGPTGEQFECEMILHARDPVLLDAMQRAGAIGYGPPPDGIEGRRIIHLNRWYDRQRIRQVVRHVVHSAAHQPLAEPAE